MTHKRTGARPGVDSYAAFFLLTSFMALLLASSCGNDPSPTPTALPEATPTRTATASAPTATSTATPTPVPIPTATPTPPPVAAGYTTVSGSLMLEGVGAVPGIEVTFSQEPEVEVIAKGLVVPWALDFAPDGRIFVTERPGRIRIIKDGLLLPEPFAVMEGVYVADESGLMGLALHPDFATNHYLYVYYMHELVKGKKWEGRVVRFTDSDDKGTDQTVVFSGVQGASAHIGGRIKFGPDGKLYITTGEDSRPF